MATTTYQSPTQRLGRQRSGDFRETERLQWRCLLTTAGIGMTMKGMIRKLAWKLMKVAVRSTTGWNMVVEGRWRRKRFGKEKGRLRERERSQLQQMEAENESRVGCRSVSGRVRLRSGPFQVRFISGRVHFRSGSFQVGLFQVGSEADNWQVNSGSGNFSRLQVGSQVNSNRLNSGSGLIRFRVNISRLQIGFGSLQPQVKPGSDSIGFQSGFQVGSAFYIPT
ncbi:hypothetical protein GQ457_16G016080 [Hibiscus cannabinus]